MYKLKLSLLLLLSIFKYSNVSAQTVTSSLEELKVMTGMCGTDFRDSTLAKDSRPSTVPTKLLYNKKQVIF